MPEHIELLTKDLAHWREWVAYEEHALANCQDEETKILLRNRLAMGQRNVLELEKAIEVFSHDDIRGIS